MSDVITGMLIGILIGIAIGGIFGCILTIAILNKENDENE